MRKYDFKVSFGDLLINKNTLMEIEEVFDKDESAMKLSHMKVSHMKVSHTIGVGVGMKVSSAIDVRVEHGSVTHKIATHESVTHDRCYSCHESVTRNRCFEWLWKC